MAKLKWTPQEFIAASFSPMIAVATSSTVENICRKNALTFIELLAPFCKLNAEVQLKDPSGGISTMKNLRVQLVDINARPPQPILARKFLNASVAIPSENVRTTQINNDTVNLDIPTHVPWFDHWRETFLQVQFPSEHEFTYHYLACIFVVSSGEQNPLEQLNVLMQHLGTLQTSVHAKVPKWFNNNILKYFVLVHDTVEANNDVAIQTFESLKHTYGANNCYFLPTNSRPPDENTESRIYLPDPWAQFLTRRGNSRSSSNRSSPKTPTESSVGSMPSSVSSASSTPPMSRSMGRLEIGQEANEVSTSGIPYHPLSPENENRPVEETQDAVPPLNTDVWRGSPSVSTIHGIHGSCLSMDDIQALKVLVHEFCIQALIPYVERQLQAISEQISNKKGVSRSLFSATKRWFTPSKPGTTGSATAFNSVVYANDSTEIQLRRLADLYFMFGNYPMAFQAYHTVKRDFMADQAWLYYSGAIEMAGLAAFMSGELNRKAMEYLDESITTYLNICKMPQFATRATLFSAECLKGKKMYGEAANQYIRMTSEDSDLRSALLLEQAAYCFLYCVKPKMMRKYAFHIVLSGHRFTKCNQKRHSLRCYRQAFQIYEGKNWSLAEDHIHYTIGRQAASLQLLEEATNSFAKLITATSRQTPQQQAVFLKEYLLCHQSFIREKKLRDKDQVQSLPVLPIPLIEPSELKVLLGPQQPMRTPGRLPASGITFTSNFEDPIHEKWRKLEEMMVQECCNMPGIFKPQVTFFTSKNATIAKPVAVIGEPIQIAVVLRNPLQIPLPLKDLYLLWTFKGRENDAEYTLSNETADIETTDKYIRTHVVKNTCVPLVNMEEVILTVTPLAVGELVIEGIGYTVVNTIPPESSGQYCVAGKHNFLIKGARIKGKEKEGQPQYAPDRKVEIVIAPSAPCLQVGFSDITQELLANEIQSISIELRNCGSTPLCRIMMASTVPNLFSLANPFQAPVIRPSNRKSFAIPIILPPQFNERLEPGQSHTMTLWLRAPESKGITSMDLLFYYENIDPTSVPRYRLVRHQWHLSVQDSLELEMQAAPSFSRNMVETVAMSLTALNSNQVHHAVISEVILDQASLISNNWILLTNTTTPKGIKLNSQEKIHILLKAHRSLSKTGEPNHSKKTFQRDHFDVNPEVEAACMDFARRAFMPEPLPFPGVADDISLHIEALLVVGWQAVITDSAGNRRHASGQHHLPIKNLSSAFSGNKENVPFASQKKNENLGVKVISRPDFNSPTSLQKQVTYNMIHPSSVNHNFSTGFVCIVPVLLVLNSTVDTPLIVKVNTLGTSSDNPVAPSRFELANPQSLSNFRWIGHCEFLVEMLPYTSTKLTLNSAFMAPGTYDLGGRIEILCRAPESPYSPVMQNVSYDASIVVQGV